MYSHSTVLYVLVCYADLFSFEDHLKDMPSICHFETQGNTEEEKGRGKLNVDRAMQNIPSALTHVRNYITKTQSP